MLEPAHRKERRISLRTLPLIVAEETDAGQSPLECDTVSPYTFPSRFMAAVEFFTKRYKPECQRLWTYIRDDEAGRYLEQSGYVCDKQFTRRGVAKRLYIKDIHSQQPKGDKP